MLFLVQGSMFLKGPIPLILSVTALVEIILHTSRHVISVSGAQVMIVK